MRLHRRTLRLDLPPGDEDCQDPYGHGCPWPPPVPSTRDFASVPAPSPSIPPGPGIPPCLPGWGRHPAPAPSPHGFAAGGRRDQGQGGYVPAPPAGAGTGDGHGHSHRLVMAMLIAAATIAFVSLILLGVSVVVRRRQVRRRRQALLAPAAPAGAAAIFDGGGNDPEGGAGGGGVVHHIWYIRTVGLEEAAINSIAVTRYRAGAGLLGAADCSVCLGEFQDGDLVRLLPKCGHAFHVPCIDTWLRAHVNCPLCRADVLDPAVTGADDDGDREFTFSPPVANANAEAEQAAAVSDATPDREEEESDHHQEASPSEEDQHEQSSPPEPLPPRNVRRAASMDAAIVSTAGDFPAPDGLPDPAPEEEQQISGRRKRCTGPALAKPSGSGHRSDLSIDRPASGGVPRSFFSRHCRARSSVLPL